MTAHCCWCWYDAHPRQEEWCHGVEDEALCREHADEAGETAGDMPFEEGTTA